MRGSYDEIQARSANLEGACSLMQRNASTFAPILSSNSAVPRGNSPVVAPVAGHTRLRLFIEAT